MLPAHSSSKVSLAKQMLRVPLLSFNNSPWLSAQSSGIWFCPLNHLSFFIKDRNVYSQVVSSAFLLTGECCWGSNSLLSFCSLSTRNGRVSAEIIFSNISVCLPWISMDSLHEMKATPTDLSKIIFFPIFGSH